MDKFFAVDGPLMTFLNKFGQLIMLTFVWLLCCIPVVTIVGSSNSFYYAVIKSVRREVGYPIREFFKNFKRTLKDGLIFNVILILWAVLLWFNLQIITHTQITAVRVLYIIYFIIIALTVAWVVYLLPVLSRFDVPRLKMAKMSLMMIFLQPLKTVILVAVPVAVVALAIYKLPVACLAFIPGVWVYMSTWLIEPVLKRFMGKPSDDSKKEWYDE
ncbi:MAG: YesL family protein [Lachnospiraceae bacterium]|nr:YesL family protein [Lachnospiraceae bacterium]